MSSGKTDSALELAHNAVASGDEAASQGRRDEARQHFAAALDAYERAGSALGQGEVQLRLLDLAEEDGDLAAAHDHGMASVAPLQNAIALDSADQVWLGVALMQVARIKALAGVPDAEATFRSALRVASDSSEAELRGTVWHYLGAWCERRELPLAALLAFQESFDAFPPDSVTERLRELRSQVVVLQPLGEWVSMIGTIRLLENENALDDTRVSILPTWAALTELELSSESEAQVRQILEEPDGAARLRDHVFDRARAALPDFARRFEAGELSLADTASVALPQETPRAPVGVAEAFGLLETAAEQAQAWRPEAEDTFRAALRASADADYTLAYGWDRVGAYLLGRAQSAGALLAYNAALQAAESAGVVDPDSAHSYAVTANAALYGATYALAGVGETHAQLACIALLERRRALDGLPTIDRLLSSQNLGGSQQRRLHRKLDNDCACRRSLAKAVSRAAREFPDFEWRFIAGEERFDSPERLLTALSTPVRNPRRREIGAAGVRQLYRKRLRARILVPALVLAGACTALFTLGAASWPWPVKAALVVGALIYVAVWIGSVRAVYGWVRATRHTEEDRLIDDLELEASTHAEAYANVERFVRDRTPFALYLRSFDIEASETVVPIADAQRWRRSDRANAIERAVMQGMSPSAAVAGLVQTDQWLISRIGSPSEVDAYLGERVARHIAVITVSNPAAIAVRGGRVPRLELGHDTWDLGVRLLISAAHLIVVECFNLTPGVLTELKLIQNRGRAAETVIVLPSTKSGEEMTSLSGSLIPGLAGVEDAPQAPIITRNAPALRVFARVIEEDSLLADDPNALDVFAGLLPSDDESAHV
jgi:hypothetical protein